MRPAEFQKPIVSFFRGRRFRDFNAEYGDCRSIVDFGGEHNLWQVIGLRDGLTFINIFAPKEHHGYRYIIASGFAAPFADKSVDLAFSNSVIEHVGSEANQFAFASEMMRVGRRVYCQTPSRLFPIDPHLSAFFLHWLPGKWLTPTVLRWFTGNGWLWRRKYHYDVTWISKRKLRKMFPGCKIKTERFLLLPKSFVVTN